MKEPKKLFVEKPGPDGFDNWCTSERYHKTDHEYISVAQLKEWVKENVSNEENQAGVHMIVVDADEILNFIES